MKLDGMSKIDSKLENPLIQQNMCNVTVIVEYSNATPIRSHTDVGYNCCFCMKAYPDPANLKQHTRNAHTEKKKSWLQKPQIIKLDITSLHCSLCGDNINTIEQIILHLKAVHVKKFYTDVTNLIIPFKFDTKKLTCCICSAQFYNYKSLQQHMNQHYRNYVCDICDAGYMSQRSFREHKVSHKTGSFACDYCEKQFTTLANKKLHERVHVRKNALKCDLCNVKKFRNLKDQAKHLKEMHSIDRKELKCLSCNKTYYNIRSLLHHTKRYHLKEKKILCSQCGSAFYSTKQLKNHMLKHTGKRDFTCDVCNKSYGRKFTLQQHMRIHADDRRFKCEHCKQTFVYKCSWKGHMRSKHGDQV